MKDSRFSEVYQINGYPSRILLSVNAVSSVHGMSTPIGVNLGIFPDPVGAIS